MGWVYFVSQTPGLVSFGKKKKGEEEKKSSFEFPMIEENGHQFRKDRADGTVEQVYNTST
jgi:hypothetical protein